MNQRDQLFVIVLGMLGLIAEASGNLRLPENYESLSACEKQDLIWNSRIRPSEHRVLPPLRDIDLLTLFRMSLGVKMEFQSDEAPIGWKKPIHAHGSVATIRWVAEPNQPFEGVFEGAECGLIRLSLTYDPLKRGVAPGVAIKLFQNQSPSVNVSLLTSLDSQGQDYNFFKRVFSNIVAPSNALGPKIIGTIFRTVDRYDRALGLSEWGENAPKQIFLKAPIERQLPSTPARDLRLDFHQIPKDTELFSVFIKDQHGNEIRIGRIFTTSSFVSSEFGDSGLYFRHERFKK